jgi:hypothetical protein
VSRRRSTHAGLLALIAAVAACHGSPTAGADANAIADATATTDASATATEATDAHAGAGGDDEAAFFWGVPKSVKSIGHTSVVFKLELTSGKKAVFKPSSRRGPLRYKGEIAARRLATALGLTNVPPAYFRALEAKTLSGAPGSEEMIVSGTGLVKGALMPWIDHLEFIALEQVPLSAAWKQWLKKSETIPADQRDLARQVSTMVAFDFITGNWDRFSGGNVGIDRASGTLLYIDNDGAFFDVPPNEGLLRNKKLLDGIDRFSRSFITKARAADDETLTRALGEETPGAPLLSAKALAGVTQRRKALLEIIDAKLTANGDDETYTFP